MKVIQRISSVTVMCLLSLIIFFSGENKAYAHMTISAQIPVTCLETSDDDSHIYEIKIKSENDNSPVPNSDTLRIKANETGYFEINITEPGTFTYNIYEVSGNDSNIQYDRTVYNVMLFVENSNDGKLVYSIVANIVGREGKPAQINFQNTIKTVTSTTSKKQADTVTTALVATANSNDKDAVGLLDNVLTGGGSTALAFILAMFASIILITVSIFLFKRDNSEEEDKNDE